MSPIAKTESPVLPIVSKPTARPNEKLPNEARSFSDEMSVESRSDEKETLGKDAEQELSDHLSVDGLQDDVHTRGGRLTLELVGQTTLEERAQTSVGADASVVGSIVAASPKLEEAAEVAREEPLSPSGLIQTASEPDQNGLNIVETEEFKGSRQADSLVDLQEVNEEFVKVDERVSPLNMERTDLSGQQSIRQVVGADTEASRAANQAEAIEPRALDLPVNSRQVDQPAEAKQPTDGKSLGSFFPIPVEAVSKRSIPQQAEVHRLPIDVALPVEATAPERIGSAERTAPTVTLPAAQQLLLAPVAAQAESLSLPESELASSEVGSGIQTGKDRLSQSAASQIVATQPGSPASKLVVGQLVAGLNQLDDGVIEIRLSPAELGRITIQIAETVGGQTASIFAEKGDILEMLRRNEGVLEKEFENAGFGSMTFEFDQQQNADKEPDEEIAMIGSEDGLPNPSARELTSQSIKLRSGSDLDIRL